MNKQKSPKRQPLKKKSLLKKSSLIKPWHKVGLSVFLVAFVGSLFALVPQTYSATTAGSPAPTDAAVTPYGSIGKWMIQSNGQVSNWGGSKYQNKTLDEVVNVILVDPTSTSATASTTKINTVMSRAGFPSQSGHSNGFSGYINGTKYSQQPTGLNAFSDNVATNQNDHARLFGPGLATGGGYVWSGALSTEKPTFFFGILIGHSYVSFNTARDALARGFVASGQAQSASVAMGNAYNTTSTTTGDHDGKAVVIVLK